MSDLIQATVAFEAFCRARGWSFCIIGGLAAQRWGNPRYTQDADVTLLTGFGGEEAYIDALLAEYPARIEDARTFALTYRVLLLETVDGVPLDIALGAMPFEERSVARASTFAVNANQSITTCSAEDLIVHKAFAGRDQDWLDIRGIIARQGKQLNTALIWSELTPLAELKEDTTSLEQLRRLLGS